MCIIWRRCKNNNQIKCWWTPKKQGPGRDDFLYSYIVPPKEKGGRKQHQYIQSEGKLTFKQYKILVQAVHDDLWVVHLIIIDDSSICWILCFCVQYVSRGIDPCKFIFDSVNFMISVSNLIHSREVESQSNLRSDFLRFRSSFLLSFSLLKLVAIFCKLL